MSPFTTYVYMIGPNEEFKFSSKVSFELQVSMNLNSAKGLNYGKYSLKYKNGNEYTFNWPEVLNNKQGIEAIKLSYI